MGSLAEAFELAWFTSLPVVAISPMILCRHRASGRGSPLTIRTAERVDVGGGGVGGVGVGSMVVSITGLRPGRRQPAHQPSDGRSLPQCRARGGGGARGVWRGRGVASGSVRRVFRPVGWQVAPAGEVPSKLPHRFAPRGHAHRPVIATLWKAGPAGRPLEEAPDELVRRRFPYAWRSARRRSL